MKSILFTLLAAAAAAADRPNVLFIAVDDLRPELACYGVSSIQSPNIDRLASRSLVLDRAYCQVAQCNQSRVSLLTGLRPDTTGVHDIGTNFRGVAPDATTMPQFFRRHGYRALAYGKVFHDDDEASWSEPNHWPPGEKLPLMTGPDPLALKRWLRQEAEAVGVELDSPEASGRRTPAYGPVDVADDELADGLIARAAASRLRELASDDEPFFLAVGFLKPHMPFIVPRKWWDLYPDESIELPANRDWPRDAPEVALHFFPEMRENNYGLPPGREPLPDRLARNMIRGYRAAVSYVDAQVGLVLEALEESGLADDTIVVLWGDHGFQLGENGMWSKHTNYELATRVPLMIVPPGGISGIRSSSLVECTDVFATLAELSGLPAPETDGRSFAKLLENPSAPHRKATLSQWQEDGLMGYALRTEHQRYVEWIDEATGEVRFRELYDHRNDPRETRNVVAGLDATSLEELSARLHHAIEKP